MKRNNKKWEVTQRVASSMIVVFSGVVFYLALSHFDTVRRVAGGFMSVISPFVVGIAIAYLLDGPARYFQRHLFKKSRGLSVALAFVCALLAVMLLVGLVVPQVVQSLLMLVNGVPGYLNSLTNWVQEISAQYGLDTENMQSILGSYKDLVSQLTTLVSKLAPRLLNYGVAIGSGVISAITAVISSLYMLLEKEKLLRQMRKVLYAFLPYHHAQHTLEVCSHANRVFSGFINGKLLDSFIIGIICFVVTALFKMPFALLISVIVGVTNVIPFFGPFIGAIPSIMLLLIIDPLSALEFGIFIIVLQQFDGNILGPKILGDSTGLSALWVLVAITVGGGLFGFPGMVLGVPTFAVLYSLMSDWLANRLREKKLDEAGNPLPCTQAAEEEAAKAPAQLGEKE